MATWGNCLWAVYKRLRYGGTLICKQSRVCKFLPHFIWEFEGKQYHFTFASKSKWKRFPLWHCGYVKRIINLKEGE